IAETFDDVFTPDGTLDRQKLGERVFADAQQLARLDCIVRAHVPRETVRRAMASGADLIGVDAIKLMESGLGALCDATVAVLAPEETRVHRIMTRDGISEEYARARVRAQQDEAFFRAHCSHVFVNDYQSLDEAQAAAGAFLKEIIKQLKEDKQHV
ncbi:MAG: dephospho-CoA kinase, partial [Oscillospiraceae bacterium]|nr:dephospho-CoA kinase [Oscillospiraceae bacterium]